jgi:hypothetical protein
MSVSHIPEKVKIRLWGKAAGRCQYRGCNKPLYIDAVTKAEFNIAYIAHIVADSTNGPRGDKILSEQLKADISNLILMCDEHHRLIDRGNIEGHPVELLQEMKQEHEQRIDMLSSLNSDAQSHIVLYGANIGEHSAPISFDKAVPALLPNKYPAEKPAIEMGFKNSSFYDNEEIYWIMEKENLNRQFKEQVIPKLKSGNITHLSIFAFAPQPLLIELGRLLGDIHVAEVYQLHREPPTWEWQEKHTETFIYEVEKPVTITDTVAINLSLSATINDERITNIIGTDSSIWTVTIENPNNDFLQNKEQLSQFRELFRNLLNEIKDTHGEKVKINIFPAAPVAIAVEMGRVWMPKADLSMVIYDQNNKEHKFIETLTIGG